MKKVTMERPLKTADKKKYNRERYLLIRKPQRTDVVPRTGEERQTKWHKVSGSTTASVTTVKDFYDKYHAYQTRAVYDPPVFTFNMVVDNLTKGQAFSLIKQHLKFDRYILVMEELKGFESRYLMEFYCRLPQQPELETVYALYKAFCQLS